MSAVYIVKIEIYKTVTFSVALYGCEAWSLTLTEEIHRWSFRIFKPTRGATGGW
jgi:hypothetical protein